MWIVGDEEIGGAVAVPRTIESLPPQSLPILEFLGIKTSKSLRSMVRTWVRMGLILRTQPFHLLRDIVHVLRPKLLMHRKQYQTGL